MKKKVNRRNFLKAAVAATAALVPAAAVTAKPCGLKELPIGWIFEYSLSHWKDGHTSKSFVEERQRPYYGKAIGVGPGMCAEEFVKWCAEGLREIHEKHGIVVLRYYPVYAGTFNNV